MIVVFYLSVSGSLFNFLEAQLKTFNINMSHLQSEIQSTQKCIWYLNIYIALYILFLQNKIIRLFFFFSLQILSKKIDLNSVVLPKAQIFNSWYSHASFWNYLRFSRNDCPKRAKISCRLSVGHFWFVYTQLATRETVLKRKTQPYFILAREYIRIVLHKPNRKTV